MSRIVYFAFLIVPISGELQFPWLEQISREQLLMKQCNELGLTLESVPSQLDHFLVDHNHKFLYCYVPKVACTNWKRVMLVLTGFYNTSNLLEIPSNIVHSENSTTKLSQLSEEEQKRCFNDYVNFLMVRHPFERILSAYRNKFLEGNSNYFQKRYGRHIIKTYRVNASQSDIDSGANVSFGEFVKYLLIEGTKTNEHWDTIYNLCSPCTVNYTFIGFYETLEADTKTVLDMIQAPHLVFPLTKSANTRKKIRFYFQQLSLDEIQALYNLYKLDFLLFGYGLEDILGYELG